MKRLPLQSPNARSPIGVFDSGIGGLSVLRALAACMPSESTVYLGDTARVPYGTKSPEVVTRYALANALALTTYRIKLLVVACNTASAVAIPALARALPIPVVGVIEAGAEAALASTRARCLAIIGTDATVASGAYQRAIFRLAPHLEVRARSCPLFVPLVEEGWIQGDVPKIAARRYLGAGFLDGGVDTLILGCTHYPLLAPIISEVVGPGIRLIDSGVAVAEKVKALMKSENLAAPEGSLAQRRYLVTDSPTRFMAVGGQFLGEPLTAAKHIDLEVAV